MGRGELVRKLVSAAVLALAVLPATGPTLAKGPREKGPGLRIVADRVVGFVPFTVYVYGKISGPAPERIRLCRSEVTSIAESSSSPALERGRGRHAIRNPEPSGDWPAVCGQGKVVRTKDGFDFTHDLRFDRPGTYRLHLMMSDADGKRTISNTVRVSAF